MRRIHGLFVVAAGLSISSSAWAESGVPACTGSLISHNETIPPNAPALFLSDVFIANAQDQLLITEYRLEGPLAPTLTLEDDIGGSQTWLFRLSESMQPSSSYTHVVDATCGTDSEFYPNSTTFSTLPDEVALPATIGSVEQVDVQNTINYVHLQLTPSAELEAYLPLCAFNVLVNGVSVYTTSYGLVDYRAPVISVSEHSICTQMGVEAGVTTAEVELRAHVAGASTDPPPVTLLMQVDCGDEAPDAGVVDADAVDADAAVPTQNDGSPPALTSGGSEDDACGCRVGPQPLREPPTGLGLLLASALMWRRRRRHR